MGKREERLAVIRRIVRNTKVSTQAQLLRLVREESGGITLPAPLLPVEVGSSYFEACP